MSDGTVVLTRDIHCGSLGKSIPGWLAFVKSGDMKYDIEIDHPCGASVVGDNIIITRAIEGKYLMKVYEVETKGVQ